MLCISQAPRPRERWSKLNYAGMIVAYVHTRRGMVAIVEHFMQANFKANSNFKNRIANMRSDFDDHIPFDHSDEEDKAATGPQ